MEIDLEGLCIGDTPFYMFRLLWECNEKNCNCFVWKNWLKGRSRRFFAAFFFFLNRMREEEKEREAGWQFVCVHHTGDCFVCVFVLFSVSLILFYLIPARRYNQGIPEFISLTRTYELKAERQLGLCNLCWFHFICLHGPFRWLEISAHENLT